MTACGAFGGEDDPPDPSNADGEKRDDPPHAGTPEADEFTEAYGVFAAIGGPADADGSRAKPFGTIAAATERARATNKRVYVCNGTFKEPVTLARAVHLIGGLDCSSADWRPGPLKTRIEAPTSPALRAEGIDQPTRVEGFDFVAPEGTAQSPSSIGLIAKNAGALTITRSTISAGKGADGAPGTEGIQLTLTTTKEAWSGTSGWVVGSIAVPVGGQRKIGTGGTATCTGAPGFDVPSGGNGGLGGAFYSQRCTGFACPVTGYEWITKVNDTPQPGIAGHGEPAKVGQDGQSAGKSGTLSPDGFAPADGTGGTNGTAGKSGAGGNGGWPGDSPDKAGLDAYGASGPGGGSGGCPGLAGTAGKGGGASIGALLSSSAGLTFVGVEITASNGGNGGKGTFGSSATEGGKAAAKNYGAFDGYNGEEGGRSGSSGSGAGGSSFGVAHTGGEPKFDGGAVKAGAAGAGVAEEIKPDLRGYAKTIRASVPGEAKDVIAF